MVCRAVASSPDSPHECSTQKRIDPSDSEVLITSSFTMRVNYPFYTLQYSGPCLYLIRRIGPAIGNQLDFLNFVRSQQGR